MFLTFWIRLKFTLTQHHRKIRRGDVWLQRGFRLLQGEKPFLVRRIILYFLQEDREILHNLIGKPYLLFLSDIIQEREPPC